MAPLAIGAGAVKAGLAAMPRSMFRTGGDLELQSAGEYRKA